MDDGDDGDDACDGSHHENMIAFPLFPVGPTMVTKEAEPVPLMFSCIEYSGK